MPIGFSISFKIDTKNYNKKILKANLLSIKKLIIALAGPLVNLAFIVLFFVFYPNIILIYINILIFIFNMIPIYPLDGGRILKYILHIFFGKQKALFITNLVSNILAVATTILILYLSIITINIAYIFVVIYVWIIVIRENKKYKIRRKLYKILENNIAINKD